MKKTIIYILISILIAVIVLDITTAYTAPKIYKDNYLEIYKMQLDSIFENQYSVSERRTVSGIKNPEGPKYYFRYYEWDIEYEDNYGTTFYVTLNNKEPFENQVYSWLCNQIECFYCRSFVDSINRDGNLYCYCSICVPRTLSRRDDTSVETLEAETYYNYFMEELENGKSKIHLNSLPYDSFFREYPFSIEIRIKNSPVLDEKRETLIEEQAKQIISNITSFTNETCCIYLSFQIDDKPDHNTIFQVVGNEIQDSQYREGLYYEYQIKTFYYYKNKNCYSNTSS